jgi:cation-transporting ATPase 13A2
MCGDGANDCGALKTADVGISLSEAEASIAAPFTSAVQNIECVVTLLREGRASMATSFQSFKFIELYALIQFFSVVLLIPIECNLTDRQFLYIDLVALVPLSIFQARTGAYSKLSSEVPTATLFYAPVLASVAGSAAIQFVFQLFWFLNVRQQTQFYTEPETIGKDTIAGSNIISYEDSVLFLVSIF